MIFLSYILDHKTPTYGNKNKFKQIKKNNILNGDIANNTYISTSVHIGTHIDMPYHFYEKGQTVEDFSAEFWAFKKPLIIEIKQNDLIINEKLTKKLDIYKGNKYDILIVKTGICNRRTHIDFWEKNYGFHPDIAKYLKNYFPSVRVFGFDSISVSSFSNRILGREAHKSFLNPSNPILLLEDMDLRYIDKNTKFDEILISPVRISKCDGLPCTVFGRLNAD